MLILIDCTRTIFCAVVVVVVKNTYPNLKARGQANGAQALLFLHTVITYAQGHLILLGIKSIRLVQLLDQKINDQSRLLTGHTSDHSSLHVLVQLIQVRTHCVHTQYPTLRKT